MPSGASKGDYEAVEIRDNDQEVYDGKSVRNAVANVEEILAPALLGKAFHVATDLDQIDDFMTELDGTDDKSRLGANAILGISMACARAGAAERVRFLRSAISSIMLPTELMLVLLGRGFHFTSIFVNFLAPRSRIRCRCHSSMS